MNRWIEIELDHSEGALLRVLGTVERRGFALIEMTAAKQDAETYSVRLQVAGDRDPEVLCRQLERLVDTRAVRLLPVPPEEPPPPGFKATWL